MSVIVLAVVIVQVPPRVLVTMAAWVPASVSFWSQTVSRGTWPKMPAG